MKIKLMLVTGFLATFIGLSCRAPMSIKAEELNEAIVGTNDCVETIVEESQIQTTSIEMNAELPYGVWTVEGATDTSEFDVILNKVNALRAEYNMDPVVLDKTITKSAFIRAEENTVWFDHSQPGYPYVDTLPVSATEIIVINAYTAESAVDAWINSGMHKQCILRRFWKYAGIGQVNGNWVMMFRDDTYDQYYKPLTDSELKAYDSKLKYYDVTVSKSILDVNFIPAHYYFTDNVKMDMGQTKQLEGFIKTAGWMAGQDCFTKVKASTITWSSSNKNIASVDSNGVVTAMNTGNADITGTLNGKTIKYTIKVSENGNPVQPPLEDYLVKYRTHVQNVGWQGYVADGSVSGTSGRSLRLEGINIALDPSISGGIEYRTHVQNIGWQNYVSNGVMSGTEGKSYRLEGINIRLTGEAANKYDIYYRVHTQNIGWMGWAKNGEASGSAGYAYRLEGIQVQLVEKGGAAPGVTTGAFVEKK